MIKINLTPVEELENPYWWVLDAAVVAIVSVIAFVAADILLEGERNRISQLQQDTQQYKQSYEELQSDLGRFDSLEANIAELNTKLNTLQQISVSKATRYRPVIVLEHLQNLKPEGTWFSSVTIGGEGNANAFSIQAGAFDNILVAEFMTSLQATQAQEVDPTDMRTQIYFNSVDLERTSLETDGSFPDLGEIQRFNFTGTIAERGTNAPAISPDGNPLEDMNAEMPEEIAPNASLAPQTKYEVTF